MSLKKNGNGQYHASPPPPPPLQKGQPPRAGAIKIRAQKWLQPIARGLDSERLLVATKSSFLIGINGLMLAVSAHAFYGTEVLSWRSAALIPLAVTNLLSLVFAVASASVREASGRLDLLWAKTDDEYAPALAEVLETKESLGEAFAEELHVHGAALEQSKRYLRSGYHVLLGGAVLSAVTFTVCLAFGAATP